MARRKKLRLRGFSDSAHVYRQIFEEPIVLARNGDCVKAAKEVIRRARLVPVETSAKAAYERASDAISKSCPKSTWHIARSNLEAQRRELEEEVGFDPVRSNWVTSTHKKTRRKKVSPAEVERELIDDLNERKKRRKVDYPEYILRRRGMKIPVYRKKVRGSETLYKSVTRAKSKGGRPRKQPKI